MKERLSSALPGGKNSADDKPAANTAEKKRQEPLETEERNLIDPRPTIGTEAFRPDMQPSPPKYEHSTVRPDADFAFFPVEIALMLGDPPESTRYQYPQANQDRVGELCEQFATREVDTKEMPVYYADFSRWLERVPYFERGYPDSLERMPASIRDRWNEQRFFFQRGAVRATTRMEDGEERLFKTVFYNQYGAPALVIERFRGGSDAFFCALLEYDQRGYLARAANYSSIKRKVFGVALWQVTSSYDDSRRLYFSNKDGVFRLTNIFRYTEEGGYVWPDRHNGERKFRSDPFSAELKHYDKHPELAFVLPIPGDGKPEVSMIVGQVPRGFRQVRFWLEIEGLNEAGAAAIAADDHLARLSPRLTRKASQKDLETIVSLTQAVELRIDGGNPHIASLAPLAALTDLQSFEAPRLEASLEAPIDLAPLAGLSHLQRLSLKDTLVTNVTVLASLGNLKRLVLNGSTFDDISFLAGTPALENLSIGGSYLRIDDLHPLAQLGELRSLALEGFTAATNRTLAPLSSLRGLESLYLRNFSALTSLDFIAGLDHLERVSIKGKTPIRNIDPLFDLPKLKYLALPDSVANESIAALQRERPGLRIK